MPIEVKARVTANLSSQERALLRRKRLGAEAYSLQDVSGIDIDETREAIPHASSCSIMCTRIIPTRLS
jgi:hypothetical protein